MKNLENYMNENKNYMKLGMIHSNKLREALDAAGYDLVNIYVDKGFCFIDSEDTVMHDEIMKLPNRAIFMSKTNTITPDVWVAEVQKLFNNAGNVTDMDTDAAPELN